MIQPYTISFYEGLTPEDKLSVDEWADKHRVLSTKASAEPGRYRTARTPYMREIMQLLSADDETQEVVLMKASQIGATEIGNNWIGYVIDHCPAPMLAVQPTVDLAKRNSKSRIEPLIDECPRLLKRVKDKRARDSSNTMLVKEFPGGVLVLTGANSAVGLRSLPCRFVFGDEIDAYPLNVDEEGSPIELAKKRARTFSKRKFFWASTPTVEGRSEIAARYEASDQRLYKVPCPCCGHMQNLVFTQIKWKRDEKKKLIRKSVHYECIECKGEIKNWQKTKMLKAGKWVAQNPGARVAGFHINGLYSPVGWSSWADMAESFLESKDDPNKLRTFVNTELGETWKDKSEVPDFNRLYERRASYEINTVPTGGVFLTAGVDIQEDRIEVEVLAWGREFITWSVDFRVLDGDTSTKKPWGALEKMLLETWPRADNENLRLGIKLMAVDSGYRTQTVYRWVRKFLPNRVIAIKGDGGKNSVISAPTPVDVTVNGVKFKKGLKIWTLGVDLIKTELYGWLRLNKAKEDEPDPLGYCHFPEYSLDYFKQLTAEELQVKVNKKGFTVYEFVKVRERNEALDCRVYNRAAAAILGIERFKENHWTALAGEAVSVKSKKYDSDPGNKKRKRKKRESNWL